MRTRRLVGGIGRTMIAAGVLILLFVAYQLWGTGLAEARSQRDLKHDFESVLRRPTTTTSTTLGGEDPPAAEPREGAVAIIEIPKIGVEKAVVEGVGVPDLKKGPGHYPTTPLPGQPGNAAIAGHRTTYGAPFFSLDKLDRGDPIFVRTKQGSFRYEVTEKRVVRPGQTDVLDPTEDNRLTLTTCNPRFSASQRLILIAALKGGAAPAPPQSETGGPATIAGSDAEEGAAGLSGARAARRPAFAWGALALLIAAGCWAWGRVWRPWKAYLVGAVPFLVVLFLFFENFSRLLPANI